VEKKGERRRERKRGGVKATILGEERGVRGVRAALAEFLNLMRPNSFCFKNEGGGEKKKGEGKGVEIRWGGKGGEVELGNS